MWPGPRTPSMPSFILIHLTAWPQYTNVTDRLTDKTDRQTTDRGEPFYKRSPKNCNIIQTRLQFLFVVKATALKQQISKFYLQILTTEASFYIYERSLTDMNVIAVRWNAGKNVIFAVLKRWLLQEREKLKLFLHHNIVCVLFISWPTFSARISTIVSGVL